LLEIVHNKQWIAVINTHEFHRH